VAVVRSVVCPLRDREAGVDQPGLWRREADTALAAGQVRRARRFLRWILAARPDDEEAWLQLAELASSRSAQVAYLRQAYAFHPHSQRVQAALRQARTRQLEAGGGKLKRQSIPLCPLPGSTKHSLPGNRIAVGFSLPHIEIRGAPRQRHGRRARWGIKLSTAVACSLLITVLLPVLARPNNRLDRLDPEPPYHEVYGSSPTAQPAPEPGLEILDAPETALAGPLAARVNGQGIAVRALKQAVAQLLVSMANSGPDLAGERIRAQMPALRRQALGRLIDDVLVQQAAGELGITVSGGTIQASPSPEISLALGSDGLEGGQRADEQRASQEQLRRAVMDRVTAGIGSTAEMVHARQIALASKQDAWQALGQLAAGQDFGQLAKETSLDHDSRGEGGDLGWLPRRLGWVAPEVEAAAFSGQPGQIWGPFHVADRYVIVQILEHQSDRPLDLDTFEALQELDFEQWLATRRDKTDIKILIDLTSPIL
jgi:parvulin-like peptidyl-prolyl isomerase